MGETMRTKSSNVDMVVWIDSFPLGQNEDVILIHKCLYYWNQGQIDPRYFYIDATRHGNYTCGLARQAMIDFLLPAGEE